MPYRSAVGNIYDSGDFDGLLDRALKLADIDGFAARRRASEARGLKRGLGISCFLEHAGGGPGGILAMRLACRETGTFAGAASLIALMPTADAAACKPSRPIPFMLLAGTADPKIPFGGGKADIPEYKGEVVSAAGTLAPFAAAAACGDKTTKIDVADRDRNDGSRVQLEFRVGCKAPIELVRIDGGGHTLPGARARADRGQPVGARNGDIDTARVLVDFFLKGRGG